MKKREVNLENNDVTSELDELKYLDLNNDTAQYFFNPIHYFIKHESGKVKIKMENPNKTTAFGILLLLFFTIPASIGLSNSVFMYHIPEITLFIIILYGIYISFKDVYLVIDYKNNKIYQENIFKFINIKILLRYKRN